MSNVGKVEVDILLNIKEFKSKLNQVSKDMSSIGKDLTGKTATISKQITTSTKALSENMKKTSDGVYDLSKRIMNSIKGFIIYRGINFLVSGVTSGISEVIKTFNMMETSTLGLKSTLIAQGRSFQEANGFIQSYIKDGLIPLSDAIQTYKNLAFRGYDPKQIESLMTTMKDAAAFGRRAGLTMGEAVATASEGLRNENSLLTDNVGITQNVAKMWDIYAKSIGKTAQELTLAEKRTAEVVGFQREGSIAMGDAALYSDTFAGKLQLLSVQFTYLKNAIGGVIVPIVNALMPAITNAITKMTEFFNVLAKVSALIFGYNKVQEINNKLNAKAGVAAKQAGTAQNKLGDAVKKTGKKVGDNLQSFDELNTITKEIAENSDDIASADAGVIAPTTSSESLETIAPSVDVSGFSTALDDIKNKIQLVIDGFKTLFGENITNGFAKIKESVTLLGDSLSTFMNTTFSVFKEGVIKYLETGKQTTAIDTIKNAIDNVSTALATGYSAVKKLIDILNKVVFTNADKISTSIATLIDDVMRAGNAMIDLGSKLPKDTMDIFNNVITNISDNLKTSFKFSLDIIMGLLDGLGSLWSTTWEGINKVYDDNIAPLKELIVDIFTSISDIMTSLTDNVIKPLLMPVIESLGETFDRVMPKIWDTVSKIFKDIMIIINELWYQYFKPFIAFIADNILPVIKPVFTSIGKIIVDVFQSAMDIIADLLLVLDGLIKIIAGAFTGDWKLAWEGVKQIFKGIFDSLVNIVRIPMNAIVRVINNFLDTLSRIKITIPTVNIPGVGVMGGGTVGFPRITLPEIPALASGGIVTDSTLAMIGEGQYDEAVIPLGGSKFDMLISGIASAVSQAMQANQQAPSSKEVVLNIDSATIGRVLVPILEKEENRIGQKVVIVT